MYTLPLYVGIILQREQSVFLIQRQNTNWAAGCWNFPGGLVEHDESLKSAAIREAQEEVGVLLMPDDLELVHVLHVRKSTTNTQDIIGIYFRAFNWHNTPANNEPHKIVAAQWFGLDNLPTVITEHALSALSGIELVKGYAEHGW